MPSKKMGRPTDDPKPFRLDVRVSEEDLNILEEYCKTTGKTKPQAIRDGIKSLRKK